MVFKSPHYGIVLEFVSNGCLEDFIYQKKVLFNFLKILGLYAVYIVVRKSEQESFFSQLLHMLTSFNNPFALTLSSISAVKTATPQTLRYKILTSVLWYVAVG